MTDYISRQAAIDAIKEFKHGAAKWRDEQEERSDIWHRADSAIASALEIGLRVKKLPSAQQWIPCSERLPVDDDYRESMECLDGCVWYFTNKGSMGLGHYYYLTKEWFTLRDLKPDGKVIAWMPLPEPYKGEEE